ncbi:MAG: hypothetical protein OXC66_01380, partial [Roseovarius sp.]|nr:hypothetical protein [Roseovarius sp.]
VCRGRFAAGADGMSVARSFGALPMRCRMIPTSKRAFADGTIVQAPRKASGARGGPRNGALAVPAGF